MPEILLAMISKSNVVAKYAFYEVHQERDSLIGEPLVLFFWFQGISKAIDSLLKSLDA